MHTWYAYILHTLFCWYIKRHTNTRINKFSCLCRMRKICQSYETTKPTNVTAFKTMIKSKCILHILDLWSIWINILMSNHTHIYSHLARQARWMAIAGLSVAYVAMRLAIRSSCLVESDPANDWRVGSSDALSLCASSMTWASDSPTWPYWNTTPCYIRNI